MSQGAMRTMMAVAAAVCLPLGGGCSAGGKGAQATGTGGQDGRGASWQYFPTSLNSSLDVLFMIDDSPSMLPLQDKLIETGFPALVNGLSTTKLGDGTIGLPDLHVAVISSNTGPGSFDYPGRNCPALGDQGIFQSTPRAPCTQAPLPVNQAFLSASRNGTTTNFTGDLASAFGCIARLGEQGCGFEGPLKSVRWALDPLYPPPGNAGFLRQQAHLAVILVTNHDDCSVPDDSTLLDEEQQLVTDPLGPYSSYRCNRFGHLCKNAMGQLAPPPDKAPADGLQGCVSNDTATGRLTRVSDEISFLKNLKSDPAQLFVAALTGPATPYDVVLTQNDVQGVTQLEPSVLPSCAQGATEHADPAVRLLQWELGFAANGTFQSICAPSFAPGMTAIGQTLATALGPRCFTGPVPTDPATGAPKCRVVDHFRDAGGNAQMTLVPACVANGNVAPCYELDVHSPDCPADASLVVRRDAEPANGLVVWATCDPCQPGSHDIGCP